MALIDNLVSYWKLDEASGNALDAHGANALTETSGTIAATTGKINGARDFELGDTEYFAIADNTDLSLSADQAFTVAAWVQLESKPSNAVVLSKDDNGSNREFGMYYAGGGTDRLRFYVFDSGGTLRQAQDSVFGSPSLATWYFVVGWHDPVANVVGISINAGSASTVANTLGTRDLAAPFLIGAGFGTGTNWDGLIDEVGFWKRVLTSDERTALYNSGAGLPYEDFEEDEGVTGAFASTLADATMAASGAIATIGAFAATLAPAVLASSGVVTVSGSFASTLANATLAASGTVIVTGTMAAQLGNAVLAASGVVGDVIAGSMAAELGNATFSASGLVETRGTFAAVLGDAVLSAAGEIRVTGAFAAQLANATFSASGFVGVQPTGEASILRTRFVPARTRTKYVTKTRTRVVTLH